MNAGRWVCFVPSAHFAVCLLPDGNLISAEWRLLGSWPAVCSAGITAFPAAPLSLSLRSAISLIEINLFSLVTGCSTSKTNSDVNWARLDPHDGSVDGPFPLVADFSARRRVSVTVQNGTCPRFQWKIAQFDYVDSLKNCPLHEILENILSLIMELLDKIEFSKTLLSFKGPQIDGILAPVKHCRIPTSFNQKKSENISLPDQHARLLVAQF